MTDIAVFPADHKPPSPYSSELDFYHVKEEPCHMNILVDFGIKYFSVELLRSNLFPSLAKKPNV